MRLPPTHFLSTDLLLLLIVRLSGYDYHDLAHVVSFLYIHIAQSPPLVYLTNLYSTFIIASDSSIFNFLVSFQPRSPSVASSSSVVFPALTHSKCTIQSRPQLLLHPSTPLRPAPNYHGPSPSSPVLLLLSRIPLVGSTRTTPLLNPVSRYATIPATC